MTTTKNYKCFTVSIENKIAQVVMNRPEKRNSMNEDFWHELPQIIRDIDDNVKARVIILSSTGPIFSAGLDTSMLKEPSEVDKNHPHFGLNFYQELELVQNSISSIEQSRLPVIAAINGGCYGGAVDLITACDMRFGTANSFITIFEIMVGIVADAGTFPRILNFMSEGIVRELAYTGRKMHADECKQRGLFNDCYTSNEDMMTAVMQLAADITQRSPSAVYGCKRAITYSRDHSTADALEYINVWNMSMQQPAETHEAMTAQKEKRLPEFGDLPKK